MVVDQQLSFNMFNMRSVTFKNVLEVAVSCWVIPESIYR